VTDRTIERLPDPDLYRDARDLAQRGTWTPSELDGCDALLLACIRLFTTATRGTS
jgi:hypothetical protein